jgi:hypothetical protein
MISNLVSGTGAPTFHFHAMKNLLLPLKATESVPLFVTCKRLNCIESALNSWLSPERTDI